MLFAILGSIIPYFYISVKCYWREKTKKFRERSEGSVPGGLAVWEKVLSGGALADAADGGQDPVVLAALEDRAAVRAAGAGVDIQRSAAVRAGDVLHAVLRLGGGAVGAAGEIPLVSHELLLILAAGDDLAVCIGRVVHDAGAQLGGDDVAAADAAEAEQVGARGSCVRRASSGSAGAPSE